MIGKFRDKLNNLYTVVITTEENNTAKEITLGGSPFTTLMDNADNTIYKPIKYTNATVEIVTADYLFEIYSGKALGTKVELKKGNTIIWTGYATPNLYDMGFQQYKETILIECIDALSTLKYKKYRPKQNKGVVTFYEIITNVLKLCNAYIGFYVSDNIILKKEIDNQIIQSLYISEQNFYGQKEKDLLDNDVVWNSYEVLEEICKYLGFTATAIGNKIYFIDYDAVNTGSYYYYSFNSSVPQKQTINPIKQITSLDFSGNGNTLSIDNVYNKVVVKDELNTFDEVIPDIYKTAVNITSETDESLSNGLVTDGAFGTIVYGNNNNMIGFLDKPYNPENNTYKFFNLVFCKYYNNPNYKLYKYDSNGRDITDSIASLNYTDTKTMNGATIAKFFVRKMDKEGSIEYGWFGNVLNLLDWNDPRTRLDIWTELNNVSKLTFQNYIMLRNTNLPLNRDYPFLQSKLNENIALFGGKNAYLLITGSYYYHYFNNDPYPIPEGLVDISEGRYTFRDAHLKARILWGNLYWSGDTSLGDNGWVNNTVDFTIDYLKGNNRADATMFKNIKFENTVNWRVGTEDEGYLISLPKKSLVAGSPILTIYNPLNPDYHNGGTNRGKHYKHSVVFLKDFNFKAIIADPTFSKEDDTDTVYTNIIDDDYITELEEVKFRVCTFDNKKPNYSAVAYKEDNKFHFLDSTYNKALATELLEWNGNETARLEELYIYKVQKQYRKPAICLNLNLRNDIELYNVCSLQTFSGKTFVVDTINKDYKNGISEVKLVEKK